jgi:uncharacterized protein YigE (DUF2233 family)
VKSLAVLLLSLLTLPISGSQSVGDRLRLAGVNNADVCRAVMFEGSHFTQCIAVPGQHRIAMHIVGRNGILHRRFLSLAGETRIASVAFGVNGGMYDARSRPIGYYVEGSERLYSLNRRSGSGNFYMQPNGVFFGSGSAWQVIESGRFAAQVDQRPDFGTQSGPMLVIDGALNPNFAADGASHHVRNAVGVDRQGRAHFIISDEEISFGRMARMMRDVAHTPNALYLDGEVSALWNPAKGRMDGRYPLGPLILVTTVANEAP